MFVHANSNGIRYKKYNLDKIAIISHITIFVLSGVNKGKAFIYYVRLSTKGLKILRIFLVNSLSIKILNDVYFCIKLIFPMALSFK